jgi:hypothetical protein
LLEMRDPCRNRFLNGSRIEDEVEVVRTRDGGASPMGAADEAADGAHLCELALDRVERGERGRRNGMAGRETRMQRKGFGVARDVGVGLGETPSRAMSLCGTGKRMRVRREGC